MLVGLCLNVEVKDGLVNYFASSFPIIAELIHIVLVAKGIPMNLLL